MTFSLMALLTLSELSSYLYVERQHHVMVDPTLDEKLRIQFNITFHALNCDGVYQPSNHPPEAFIVQVCPSNDVVLPPQRRIWMPWTSRESSSSLRSTS